MMIPLIANLGMICALGFLINENNDIIITYIFSVLQNLKDFFKEIF